ncbi:MAG TPA: SIS domain-containing protein [Anaerolineae bacterium]|nr:SIS domain-containing protein [Anaerolineae bacterium]
MNKNNVLSSINLQMKESAETLQKTAEFTSASIQKAAKLIADAFKNGNKLLLCGNGGSAADCQHLATEFMNQLSMNFKRPGLPAIALTTDTSFITSFSNDYSFEGIFAKQIETLGKPNDILIAISTSGNSKNIIKAVKQANLQQMKVISLTGNKGAIKELSDIAITIPSDSTQHIQEAHLVIEHILCGEVENILFKK